jgi:hypothetical protein
LRLWSFSVLEILFLAKLLGFRNKCLNLDWLAFVLINSVLWSVSIRVIFAEEPRVIAQI